MVYISLHRYIKYTPSDTEALAVHLLRTGRSTWPLEKNIQNHSKLGRMKELGGKTGSVSRAGHALGGWRNWSRDLIPTLGQLSGSEEKHLRLRNIKQLICDSLKEMRIRHPYDRHTYPGQGRRSPRRCSSWELEHRDCGTIPGRGLLLTAWRWTERTWGRRLWWEVPIEESQAAMEAGILLSHA